MEFNAEEQFILGCVKLHPGDADLRRLDGLIQEVHDWEYLVTTGIARGIAPLMYKKLPLLANRALIPARVQSCLEQAYYHTFRRSALLYEEFARVAAQFKARGIGVVALKGIYLSEWLYQDIGLRQFSDIDLLVHPADGPRCVGILAGMGFRPVDSSVSEFIGEHSEIVHHTPMVRNGVSVEIHVKLHRRSPHYRLNVQEMMFKAVPAIVHLEPVKALCLNDLLVYLCVHLDKHFEGGHVQFTSFNDLVVLLDKNHQRMDWHAFISNARYHGAESTVFRYLLMVHRFYGAPLPAWVLQIYGHLLTPTDEEKFGKYLRGETIKKYHVSTHLENICELHSAFDRTRYLVELLFPPKKFMVVKYHIRRPALYLLYYPYRHWVGVKGVFKKVLG